MRFFQSKISDLSDTKRRVELDFIRGIAILLVLAFHYRFPASHVPFLDWLGATFNRIGFVGVDLFFSLSGFLVGGLILKEIKETNKFNARKFLARRAMKIWPALYVLIFFHLILGRHPADSFFWQNLFHVQNYFGTTIEQTWSLAVEEHFYLLLSLAMFLFAAKGPGNIAKAILLACFVVAAGRFLTIVLTSGEPQWGQTQYRVDAMLYGVLLSLVFHFYPLLFQQIAKQKYALLSVVLALTAWCYFAVHGTPWVRAVGITLFGIGFPALIVLVHEHSSRVRNLLPYRVIAWIGVYSYGIYLWHTLALAPGRSLVLIMQNHAINPLLAWFISVAAQFITGILFGYVMTKLVEWPFLRIREKLFPTDRSQATAAINPV